MKYIKDNYKFILILIILVLIFTIKFPYYIDAPGGISNVNDRLNIEGYEEKGSFNITYIREYVATIPTLIISLFNKSWDVIKRDDVLLDNETIKEYDKRDKLLMKESISNAILVAYNKANKSINIINNELVVLYVDNGARTDIKVGDNILSIENTNITQKEDISSLLENYDIGDSINIKVENNNKEYNRYAKIIEVDGTKKLGILLVSINEYETDPNIEFNIASNESGSSAGLITALAFYNKLMKEDITNGLTIVGTGTIDINGNVGSVSAIAHKLKSAEVSGGDIFFVPNGENYEESIKLKKEKNYKIKIVGVSTFDEAIVYLKEIAKK